MLGLGLIYALALLINNLNYRIDIIFLDYLSSSYETGIYSKAVSLSEYLWQIPAVLYTLIFARSSISKNGRLFSEKIAQLLRLAFPIICLCALSLYFLSENLVIFLFGTEFFESILLFQILLPGALFFVVFGILNMDLAGKGKPWVSLMVMIPALIINVILNIIFIPKHGAIAAAFASTISYSFAGVCFIFFYSKYAGLSVIEILKFKYSDYSIISQIFKKAN
jgi:O-antigen/teichoic acid export membrane protein